MKSSDNIVFETIKEYHEKNPSLKKRTLARLLCEEHPELFSELEKTRGCIRYYLRQYGEKNREKSPSTKIEDKGEPNTNAILTRIGQMFTYSELQAIANGGRIIPGYAKVPVIKFNGDRIRVGAISDTHIGSKYFDKSRLFQAFNEFTKEGVDIVTHSGDVTEGMSSRPGHVYELDQIGFDRQRQEAVDVLSQWKGKMFLIDGNHDRWFIKSNGAFMVKDVAKELPDAEFLGHDEGDISLGGKATLKLWHGEDGNCFDDQTEILTKRGWIPFSKLTKEDCVATMRKSDHVFEWQNPTDVYANDYDGTMFHFKSRTVDCLVTPHHGMWTRASNAVTYKRKNELTYPTKSHIRLNTSWHRKDAIDIVKEFRKQKWQFTQVSNGWDGSTPETVHILERPSKNPGIKVYHFGDVKTVDIAELIAWYVTEGHAEKSSIAISQYKEVNPENHQQIIDLIERLGCGYSVSKKCITIQSKELSEWIVAECGHLSRNKFIPEWVKECGADVLRVVLDAVIKGDGWETPNGYGYRSISKILICDVSEIAQKLGYAVTFIGKDTVSIKNVQVTPCVTKRPNGVHYIGKVYCCEVPNGLIYVRRNGKTLWTHNSYATSYRLQKVIESLSGGEKPSVMFFGHTHKSTYLFERNVHCYSMGSVQSQSSWMRSKRIAAHTGFWIIDIWVNDSGVSKVSGTFYPFYT